ncbi:energy transducer TonB [Niastella koreensis]|uniref:Outer membrane transport energization protein TonB n=2 Tax=Niastella koreensis TaxID=354356 RepID=G8TRW8_NIAKG|nr:energy transducer TonB [Niastella koreensis]AEW03303.1 outer membrane transport energization protein TonB [Niastella koreensis GR20-10]OQP55591.1 energy transducer TonB [Niastella koreensis]
MESSTILTADVLDIIFEGRNKEYGAYDLRRTYGRRLTVSIAVMLSVSLLLGIGFAFAGEKKQKLTEVILPPDVVLKKMPDEAPVEPPPPPPPPKLPVQQVQVLQFTPPRIVNEEVREDEKPPEMTTLEDTKIGTMTVDGTKDDGTVAPPIETGTTGVIETPKKDEEDWNKVFTKVEMESEYPGGMPAWARYLNKNLRFSQEALDNEIQGTVIVQFLVDKDGNVSDVEAISGPMEHRAEAVRVIKKSGKWTPAIQNGRQVKSYKKQPIVFRIETEG